MSTNAECGDDPAIARGQVATCARCSDVHRDAARYLRVRTQHPRLEVRYWTGAYWEPLTGDALARLEQR